MARNTLEPNTPGHKKAYIPLTHAILIGVVLLAIAPVSEMFKKWQEDQESKKAASIELIAKGATENLTKETAERLDAMQADINNFQARPVNAIDTVEMSTSINSNIDQKIEAVNKRLLELDDQISNINKRMLVLAEERDKSTQ